eukprot:916511_1
MEESLNGLRANTKQIQTDLHSLCNDIKHRIDQKEKEMNRFIENVQKYKEKTLMQQKNAALAGAKTVNTFYSEYKGYLQDESLTKHDRKDKLLHAKRVIEDEIERSKQYKDTWVHDMSVAIDKQHIDNAIQKCVVCLCIIYQDQSDDAEWNVISDLGETTTYNIASWGVEQCNAKVVYEINDMLRSPPSDPIHCRMVTLFEYESDFDHNGIIFCLGLDLDEDDWQNPSEKGTINIESTPLYWNSETIHHFVGRKAARCITKSIENAWFGVDFKGLQINPTHYTLRHYISFDHACLRSWDFEGSTDGEEWITIQKHINDTSLQGKGSSHTWKVDHCDAFYSFFRIKMTGKNSDNSWHLCCSGFEIYGCLKYRKPKKSPRCVIL